MDVKRIEKLMKKYEDKAEMCYRNYQDSGCARYDRERRNAEDLAEALRISLNADKEHSQLISLRADLAELASKAESAVHAHDIEKATSVLNSIVSVAAAYNVYARRY